MSSSSSTGHRRLPSMPAPTSVVRRPCPSDTLRRPEGHKPLHLYPTFALARVDASPRGLIHKLRPTPPLLQPSLPLVLVETSGSVPTQHRFGALHLIRCYKEPPPSLPPPPQKDSITMVASCQHHPAATAQFLYASLAGSLLHTPPILGSSTRPPVAASWLVSRVLLA
jgi:hypothetical protein